jgi:hypothetical protein
VSIRTSETVPLLSATERIIREAEAAESSKSAAGERSAPAGVVPPWSEATQPVGTPSEAVFAGSYADLDDFSDGVTRVDLNRSALALAKLRELDAQALVKGEETATTTEAAAAASASGSSRSISLGRFPRVGQRLGLVIAAITGAAVAPLIGLSAAHLENSARAGKRAGAPPMVGKPASFRPSRAARPAIADPVVPAAEPARGPSTSAGEPMLLAEPAGDPIERTIEPPPQESEDGKKQRRSAHQTKVNPGAGVGPRTNRAAGPSSRSARTGTRAFPDPDDTMPIAID